MPYGSKSKWLVENDDSHPQVVYFEGFLDVSLAGTLDSLDQM